MFLQLSQMERHSHCLRSLHIFLYSFNRLLPVLRAVCNGFVNSCLLYCSGTKIFKYYLESERSFSSAVSLSK